jgi:protein phosphatase
VASRLAVETIRESMGRYLGGVDTDIAVSSPVSGSPEAGYLAHSIQLANRMIFDAAKDRREYAGMGTTVVAALAQPDRFVLAYVGDSRIYRIRAGQITQVSRDHSFVQQQVDCGIISAAEAQHSHYRHMITRALGLKESVDADLVEEPAQEGDILLLCSDGLSDLLDDEEILADVQHHAADLGGACQALVDRANSKGGDDNITVVTVQAQADHSVAPERRPQCPPAAPSESGGVLAWLRRTLGRSDAGS